MPVVMQRKPLLQVLKSQLSFGAMMPMGKGGLVVCLNLALLIMIFWSNAATAVMVKDLYRQEVPVAAQGSQERAEAMSQALADVLVKVAGQRDVLSKPEVQGALAKPERYVSKFGFHTDDTSPDRQQYFHAVFDEQGVNRLLRNAGVAIWGQSRPSTLVWLAQESGGRRSIIHASETSFPEIFADSFQGRGLPLLFPLMDFEDVAAISAVDVWGGFSDKLQEASRRYGSESILAGRLSQNNHLYYGRISLIFRGENQSVAVNGLDAVAVSQLAADLVGTTLSRHYAVDASDATGKTLLMVENVSSLEDYAALTRHLESMTAVRDVSVDKVKGSTIELELVIDGSESQLADALVLGRHFQPIVDEKRSDVAAGSDQPAAKMVYRWLP